MAWHRFLGFRPDKEEDRKEKEKDKLLSDDECSSAEPVEASTWGFVRQKSLPVANLPRLELLMSSKVTNKPKLEPQPDAAAPLPTSGWAAADRVQAALRELLPGKADPPQLSSQQQLAFRYIVSSRGRDRLMMVLPTGGGKSMLFTLLAR